MALLHAVLTKTRPWRFLEYAGCEKFPMKSGLELLLQTGTSNKQAQALSEYHLTAYIWLSDHACNHMSWSRISASSYNSRTWELASIDFQSSKRLLENCCVWSWKLWEELLNWWQLAVILRNCGPPRLPQCTAQACCRFSSLYFSVDIADRTVKLL